MKLRRFFILAALAALGIVVIINLGNLRQLIDLLKQANWYVLIFILVAQTWSYFNNAKYYQAFFELFDYKLATRRLFETALALNFVNQVFPSGGVSGASYLTNAVSDEVPGGKATLAQLMRYFFTFLSFFAVLAAGFLLLFLSGDLNQVTARITLLLILVIIVTGLLAGLIISDRTRLESLVRKLVGWLNAAAKKLFRRRRPVLSDTQLDRFFHEFYEGYEFLLAERGHWRRPLLYSLGANLAEVATVYIVFLAFGQMVNPGLVIAGYALANLVSVVSVVTGGVGLYEATMVGAYAALGVPFAVAFSVVLVYRFLNFMVFLPVGFYYYRKGL